MAEIRTTSPITTTATPLNTIASGCVLIFSFNPMDTDDLTPMAYEILRMAYKACEPMRGEIGMAASDFHNEDDFLVGIAEFLREVLEDPSSYLESWNLEEELKIGVFVQTVEGMIAHVNSTLATPRIKRGKPTFER